jgi:NADH:ubiquinone oxidoreductase subunit F (NADH-binding)
MTKKEILIKIKNSKLGGRGGAGFPVWLKWQTINDSKNKDVFLLINAAEGEPNLIKDGHILSKYFFYILKGLNLALNYIGEKKIKNIYCFIRKDYYNKNKKQFELLLDNKEFKKIKKKFIFFIKPDSHDYMAGEESVLLNLIEKKPAKPRLKPPFPGEEGLFNKPSLIHNVETWYALGRISDDSYEHKRYYYLSGFVKNPGLYNLAENMSANEVLKKTNNLPKNRFFAQLGGDACGQVLLDKQLNCLVEGSGSITLYPLKAKQADMVLMRWLNFHSQQSCGQCIPCREGTYRLKEMIDSKKLKVKDLSDIVFTLKYTSFCAFGRSLADVLDNYFTNIYPMISKKSKIKRENDN